MNEDELLFGETAVARGFITRDQLDAALERQSSDSGQALGQILVSMGLITAPQAAAIEKLKLVLQRKEQAKDAGDDEETDLTGVTLGGCLILDKVALGSMGTTFRAHHLRLDRDVVVKVLHPRLVDIEGNLDRFAREARAAANLEHPAIVPVYDFDSDQGYHFIVMKYIKGQDLRQVLEARGALGLRRGLWIGARVLEGLQHAHSHQIVHRDIKPANLLITPEPRIKIADFGLVRILSRTTSEEISVFGEIIGTPQYMSPEQACGDDFDHRADIYALGITLFELIAGRPPFTGNSTLEVLEKHIVEPFPQISEFVPEATPELQQFLETLCAKKMEERFPSCDAALAVLQTLRFEEPTNRRLAGGGHDPSRSADTPPIVSEAALQELKMRLARSRSFVAFEIDDDDGVRGGEEGPDAQKAREELVEASFSGLQVNSSSMDMARRRLEEAAADPERAVPELLHELLQEGLLDEMLALEKPLEAILPTSAAVAFFLGQAYERKGNQEEARGKLALATALSPDHLPARLHLARVQVALGLVDDAVQSLTEANRWHPSSVNAAVRLAEVLFVVKQDPEAAVPAYERAIELAPTRWQLRLQLAWILYELQRFTQAEAVCREVVAWKKDCTPAKQLLKQIGRKRIAQDSAEAVAAAESELGEEGPGPQTSAYLQAIRLAEASGKWSKAAKVAQQGLKEKPRSVPLLLARARALVELKRFSDAVSCYGQALAMDPGNEEAQRGLVQTQQTRKTQNFGRKTKRKRKPNLDATEPPAPTKPGSGEPPEA